MNVIKRHKGLAIIGGLTLILLIVIFAIFSRMIFSTGKGEYGDRLNGITDVKGNTLESVRTKILENEEVEKASLRIQGKIIYTIMYVKEGTSKDKAKEIASKSILEYSEEVVKEAKEDDEKQPWTMAGTKHPDKEKISWTRG